MSLAGHKTRTLGLDRGALVIFDQRQHASPFAELGKREEHTVDARETAAWAF